ncbi:MAG: isoleucine--tRNA ligase [Clostridia bacterium]|nr:isoleucine--tRNA ligase [Clostridia bacterium]
MSVFSKVNSDMNFVAREKETLRFWRENRIFDLSVREREGAPYYTFFDGPPTANGKPHIGHVLTRVIKDMIPRYHTMKGEQVLRKAGWDTHGLPVEIEVEKQLGLDGKEQIEKFGLEPFIKKCKESVWKYKDMWEDFSDRVGFWADMENPYVTYHNEYIESEWWALRQIWDKGLLYRGYKIVPYCPRCGTPLSAQEVAQGYKTVKERSAIVKFPAADEEGTSYLAWTTTPWTLPSNVALAVHPDESYVKVAAGDAVYILAEALAGRVLGEDYTVLDRFSGKELEGRPYRPPFDFAHPTERAWYVVCADYVTMEDGTGIVHTAPAFGEDDAKTGRRYGLPPVQLVDARGRMTPETGELAGLFVKDADPVILRDLRERGLLFAAPPFEHEYPHCWRCGTPLIYYARDSWFIRMTDVWDDLVRNNDTVTWIPEGIGRGRFGSWLENVQDWGISRNRYWGTPLNIWECGCGRRHCVGSIAELREMSPDCPADIELHRPYIDAVTLTCPACGGVMRRVPEVIDCWFDSGSMPFAQWHYPFENKELFEKQFPADFISEGVDQTRGWFYSLMAISTLLFDRAPYRHVIVLGHVQDKNGQKMSKSKGNAVDPFEILEKYGADAVRWYFYINSAPWLPNRFHEDAVVEGVRKFMSTFLNTYSFFVLYANIDGFDPTAHTLSAPGDLGAMDRWLLSRLNTAVRETDAHLAAYRIPEAAHVLDDFADEMSNWYVRRCRERFWAQGMEQDKIDAYLTLWEALVTLAKLAAPMVPFLAEEIYRNLVCSVDKSAPVSVHLCDYPVCDETRIDATLEADMAEVLRAVILGRAARQSANIKTRQPLAKLYLKAETPLPAFCREIVAEELNVHQVLLTDDVGAFVDYAFKPQLKTVGPRYGKFLGEIKAALAGLDGVRAMATLNAGEPLTLPLSDGSEAVLGRDDLLISASRVEGYVSESDRGTTVVLDTALSPSLIAEGYVRELVSKIQTMRKDSGFDVTDRIRVGLSDNPAILALARENEAGLLRDVLGTELVEGTLTYAKEWKINDETVTLSVEKA